MLNIRHYYVAVDSLSSEFKHIAGKNNTVADMLSRARYEDESQMIDESDDVGTKFYSISHVKGNYVCMSHPLELFLEDHYEGDWLLIGSYLSTLTKQDGWSEQEFKRIRRKAYAYFLRDGYLWKHPKQKDATPQRVICKKETQMKLMQ